MDTPIRFHQMVQRLKDHFAALTEQGLTLYQTDADPDTIWNLYLSSFPEGTNPIFRKFTIHDCSSCRTFLRHIGGAVYIDENLEVHPITEFDTGDSTYQVVMDAVSAYVKSRPIQNLYFSKTRRVGDETSLSRAEDGTVITHHHLFLSLPRNMVVDANSTIETQQTPYRDTRNVFQRSLEEISLDAVETVLELISSDSLYRGSEWTGVLTSFRRYQLAYDRLESHEKRDLFCWKYTPEAGIAVGRIRNHSMGVLLTEITSGVPLDKAVQRYESIVAPANYKRPKPIFTVKMLEEAQKTVERLGFTESLPRRFATADDISVNNILFCNRDAAKRIRSSAGTGSVFDLLKTEAREKPKSFSRVEEVSAEDFITKILPTAEEVEAFMEARFAPNMVSLIAPVSRDAPSLFKWNNPFSWAYAGNMTDSDIRQNVKSAGGRVDGVLRFSIQWNDEDENRNDLDAHCIEPNKYHIYYGQKVSDFTGGNLDVDIIHPQKGVPAVENITYPRRQRMTYGRYRFYVRCYTFRGGRSGFKAEIEFNGQIYRFHYNKRMRQDEEVAVADVILDRDKSFSIETKLPDTMENRTIWGIKSNTFVPVSVIMYSPNYWDEQKGIGHKHYLFMLKNCVNEENPNGFYNEFLRSELAEHKRVFEALGNRMAVSTVEDQLSGIGFSSTKRNHLIVKVRGRTERQFKIRF